MLSSGCVPRRARRRSEAQKFSNTRSACGLDRFEPSEEVCEDADCGTCPACLTARKDAELAALRAEVVSLRQQLNKRTADDTVDLTAPDYPAEKKHKAGEQQHEDNNEEDDDD